MAENVKKCTVPGRISNFYETTAVTAKQVLDDETGESQLEINKKIRQNPGGVTWSEYDTEFNNF